MKRGPLAAGAVTVVLMVALYGLLRRREQDPTVSAAPPDAGAWVTYPDFRIAFPQAPGLPEHSVQMTAWGRVNVLTFKLRRPSGLSYQVQQMEAEGPLKEEGDVEGAMKRLESQAHETPKLLSDHPATIGECAGRDFSASVTGLTVRSMLCVRGTHAYMAEAVIPRSASAEEMAGTAAFFGSFEVK